MNRVLLTGASGQVAPGIIRVLEKRYTLRLLDLTQNEQFPYHEWILGSILDPDTLKSAVEDVQSVIHCAAARQGQNRTISTAEFFDVNVKGLYLLLEACLAGGIKKFVHVSSTAHVIGNWFAGNGITSDSPVTTRGRYSLTKLLQEQICEHMARNSDMRITALRLWRPCEGLSIFDGKGLESPRPYHAGWIETEDFGEACRLTLESERLDHFEILHVMATDEARRRIDLERIEEILGFRAREDFSSLI